LFNAKLAKKKNKKKMKIHIEREKIKRRNIDYVKGVTFCLCNSEHRLYLSTQ
jgi:hypothetical protein